MSSRYRQPDDGYVGAQAGDIHDPALSIGIDSQR